MYCLCSSLPQAYLEFFTSKENIIALKEILPRYPQVNYHIINHSVSFKTEIPNMIEKDLLTLFLCIISSINLFRAASIRHHGEVVMV